MVRRGGACGGGPHRQHHFTWPKTRLEIDERQRPRRSSLQLSAFGIRIALRAKGADVRRLVLGRVTRIALIGSAVGAALAFGMGRLAGATLIGVDGYDASVIAGAAMLAAIVALLAGALPAPRASAVNPIEALRADERVGSGVVHASRLEPERTSTRAEKRELRSVNLDHPGLELEA